ncbi:aminotransferase class I/II-fold pyridoxal phosphate-dependent enzyme [Alkalihalobacillus sp. CinArs1]|uniref:aminotransferase class I/II-fold pyridoxal phosphate-dependent enzyme n=1 Tax=Alkalihalobacillus sp. CinArs1 TaxID=2995314 RepID=UPI0022DDC5BF|nr:PLP-dependent aminotransferase family protein [Alkalihalobacillus sp. CinArs1]
MARLILDFDSKKPLYKQIVEYYQNAILNGYLIPGTLLPTERELAIQLEVNRSTITTAYAELRANGLITSKQGSGTRVSEEAEDLLPNHSITWNKLRNHHLNEDSVVFRQVYQYMNEPSFINLMSGTAASDLCLAKETKELIPFTMRESNGRSVTSSITSSLCQFIKNEANPENMVLTSSIEQSILIALKCLLTPGDTIAVEAPAKFSHINMLLTSGIKVIWFSNDNPLTEQLLRKEKLKLVITSPLYNQSNKASTSKKRTDLLQLCERATIPMVEIIEAPLLIHSKISSIPTYYELASDRKFVIQIGHFTGIAPGISIGWIIGPSNVKLRLQEVQMQLGLIPPPVLLELVDNILSSEVMMSHLDDVLKELNDRRHHLLSVIEPFSENITIVEKGDPTSLWIDIKTQVPDKEIVKVFLEERLLILPHAGANDTVRIKVPLFYVDREPLLEGARRLVASMNKILRRELVQA